MKEVVQIALVLAAGMLILGACSVSQPFLEPTPTQETPGAVYTSAVETVSAELTRSAMEPSIPILPSLTPSPATVETIAPTQTPLATGSPEPEYTETPVPPPATSESVASPPAQADPRPLLGNPTLLENFDTGARWALFSDDHTRMEVKDGQLQMVALNPDFWNGWAFTTPQSANFYLEMTATSLECSGLDRFGLIFRAPGSNEGYLAALTCDGRYALWTWNGSNENKLINWTASQHIESGENQLNRLGVMARGSTISLFANGQLLGEVNDTSFDDGRFGVFVGAAETPNYTVLVDELVFWELP